MANRGITGQFLTEIGKNSVEYYEAVWLDVGAGYHITNRPLGFTLGSDTYIAVGQLLDFGDINENITFEVPTLTINVSGLPAYDDSGASWTQRILNETYQNRPARISRVYFDANGDYVGVIQIYTGYIDSVGVKFTPTGESVVSIDTTSHWVDFDATRGRFTNTNSQQEFGNLNTGLIQYATDEGFSFATKVQKDIEWK